MSVCYKGVYDAKEFITKIYGIMKDKLKKLKELAEKGVEGEAENARLILKRLQEKYGITDADLNDKEEVYLCFFDAKDFAQLMVQIIRIIGIEGRIYDVTTMPKKDKKLVGCPNANIAVDCTKSEYYLIKEMFEVYYSEYKKQLRNFDYAFFAKNNLLPSLDKENTERKDDGIDLQKAMKIMQGVDNVAFNKMLKE